MPEQNTITICNENGKMLMQVRDQYISGGIRKSCSFESLRVTRIDDLGTEDSFEWLINGKLYRPKVGDFILLSGSDLRMPITREKPSTVHITILTFEPLAVFPHSELIGFFYLQNRVRHLIEAEEAAELNALFERVLSELRRNDAYSRTAAASALQLLVVELCRLIGYKPSVGQYNPASCELIGRIVVYIGEHFKEKLTVSSVAKRFGISASLLSKLMNGVFGSSFPEYVRRLRVSNVVQLIREQDCGILEAAIESGFTSVAGFYKTFREITGTSPSELKKCLKV